MRVLLAFFLLAGAAHAAEGMVVVLEAPLFARPNKDAPVVQYVRKGEKIYLHPEVLADPNAHAALAPGPEGRRRAEESLGVEMPAPVDPASTFLRAKDNQGRDAWILREHVHVWYEDRREWAQRDPIPDPTDYRLMEPLPEGYPLDKSPRSRAWAQLALASPWARSYPYERDTRNKAHDTQLELTASVMWRRSDRPLNRWFMGISATWRQTEVEYLMPGFGSRERWSRFGFGPSVSYDVLRGEKSRLSLYGTAMLYPFTQLTVTQSDLTATSDPANDSRTYWGFNAGARTGAQWQRALGANLDAMVGAWGEAELPLPMRSRNTAAQPSWWRADKGERFTSPALFSFAIFVGLQSAY